TGSRPSKSGDVLRERRAESKATRMSVCVICISHTDGSAGQDVGRAVAQVLGLRYVDEELILEAARLAQVDPSLIAAAEHKQSLVERLLEALTSAQTMLGSATLAAGIPLPASHAPSVRPSTRDDLRNIIRAAVHQVGKEGNAVIAAHAASHALSGKPGVLRVLVTAPASTRAERIGLERNLTAEEATEAISRGDEGRRDYLRAFYDIEEELPTHYDLVINTEKLTPEQAAGVIVAFARS
ncbi:MAG: AAA family ATPase, partial [Candidatus Binatia bacterium]